MRLRSTIITVLAAASLLPLGALAADPAPQAKAKKEEPRCEATATSRIRRSKEDCGREAQPVTRYSKQDLESTGQIDTAEALKRLDPRLH